MTSSITINGLGFPTIIDVGNGPVAVPFFIGAVLPPGTKIDDVTTVWNLGATQESLRIDGKLVDTFDDATPGSATSLIRFDGTARPDYYSLDSLTVRDDTGSETTFYGYQLAAQGFPTAYTVVNAQAPAAPTIALQGDKATVFDHESATLTGTAAPGSTVAVTGLANDIQAFTWIDMGSTVAGADGHWTLATPKLADGDYALVKATATSDGNTSPYSGAVEFHVAAHPPAAPSLLSHLDAAGDASSATPFVSGFTTVGASVTVYDGQTAVASTVAGRDGWYGALTAPLDAGTHSLTAVASNLAGHASAASAPLAVTVAPNPAPGIAFDIASMTNTTGVPVTQAAVQGMLDQVGAILSSLIGGSEKIALTVAIDMNPAGIENAEAAAAPGPITIDANGMPHVATAQLFLSSDMAIDIATNPYATRGDLSVLTHEMLHVLAFYTVLDGQTLKPVSDTDHFGAAIRFIDQAPYFTGFYASAVNGGPVPLANLGHLANPGDIMYTSSDSASGYFDASNPTAPLKGMDLAILKDVGYAIKDPFVGADGHTFVAGDGTPGHDHVTGTAGVDRLAVNGSAAAWTVRQDAAGATLTDTAHGVTQHLSGIERILFADALTVLDTGAGQAGGEAYRAYEAAFGRAPDAGGLGFWMDALDHGTSLDSVAAEFLRSPEFLAVQGNNLTNQQFVDLMYHNVLQRAPDHDGEAFWVNALDTGTSRAAVLIGFSESAEGVAHFGGAIGNGYTVVS